MQFYDYSPDGGGGYLQTIATDTTKYYFQTNVPPQSSPTTPVFATPVFDATVSRLRVGWQTSTDPDSPDSSISYEFNYSTSSALDDGGWGAPTEFPVVFGNSYLLGVRAKDDFGNLSGTATSTWSFPDGYAPLPSSLSHAYGIAAPDGTNGQKIFSQTTTTINGIYAWLVNPGGNCCAGLYLELREDAGGAPGTLLASSSASGLPLNTANIETLFSFPSVTLGANASYWIVPVALSSNPPVMMGASDNYADGYWSGDSSLDMYFRLQI
jgi:hypothetical protein